MPETHFVVRWPDGTTERCYSPSTIIKSFFEPGESYSLENFMTRAEEALGIASERVRARYGFACSSALDQLRVLQARKESLTQAAIEGPVTVLEVSASPARDARLEAALSSSQEQTSGISPSGAVAGNPQELDIDVVIIGGGQAGLSMSYLLKERGIQHVVLEKHRIGHSWRSERWESFCLVTPNWQCRLPGHEYSGDDPEGFMVKDEIVEFLEGYAREFSPPVREGVAVQEVSQDNGQFLVKTSQGDYRANQVVVATGGYHTPKVPGFAAQIPEAITQLHSRDYRSPEQLPQGEVLVVGSGQSGCQIVEDLLLAGRKVHLAVGDAPRCARRYRGKDVVEWLELMGHYDIPIDQMPDPAVARSKTNHYVTGRDGGHDLDLRVFAKEKALSLYGSAIDFEAGKLCFAPNLKQALDAADDTYRRINRNIDKYIQEQGIEAPEEAQYVPPWEPQGEASPLDIQAAGITSIVWSIGFAPSFDWLQVDALDERGVPRHERGVSEIPGLYFLGLPWLYTWGSGRFCGVARDASYLSERVQEFARARTGAGVSRALA